MKRILYYIPVRISFINENKQNHSTTISINMLETIKQTADYLANKISDVPNTAIILGTDLVN